MVELDGVLDDGHRETVAVRLGVGHGASAYLNPVEAAQPFSVLKFWDRVLILHRCLQGNRKVQTHFAFDQSSEWRGGESTPFIGIHLS